MAISSASMIPSQIIGIWAAAATLYSYGRLNLTSLKFRRGSKQRGSFQP